jgi:hypothetical protein
MSAAEKLAGAAPGSAPDWNSINWSKVRRTVHRLQARIVKAIQPSRRVPRGAWRRLEPYDAKVSRTVLRGRGDSNVSLLPCLRHEVSTVFVAPRWKRGHATECSVIRDLP